LSIIRERFRHSLLQEGNLVVEEVAPMGLSVDEVRRILRQQCILVKLHILTKFIESCCSQDLPFKPAETLSAIGVFFPDSVIPDFLQLSFATAMKNLNLAEDRSDILQQVALLGLWQVYAPQYNLITFGPQTVSNDVAWMSNVEARNSVKETLSLYLPHLKEGSDRVNEIVANLDVLHPMQEGAQW
jgi:hypothetical protein